MWEGSRSLYSASSVCAIASKLRRLGLAGVSRLVLLSFGFPVGVAGEVGIGRGLFREYPLA